MQVTVSESDRDAEITDLSSVSVAEEGDVKAIFLQKEAESSAHLFYMGYRSVGRPFASYIHAISKESLENLHTSVLKVWTVLKCMRP